MLLWLAFIICTTAIVYGGTKLSRYGDIIAEKSGLGRTWTGLILMATVDMPPPKRPMFVVSPACLNYCVNLWPNGRARDSFRQDRFPRMAQRQNGYFASAAGPTGIISTIPGNC